MPSSVVTTQYSPLWAPLVAPVLYCTRSLESFWVCQSPVVSSLTRVVDWPPSDSVIVLLLDQHLSWVLVVPDGFWWHDW